MENREEPRASSEYAVICHSRGKSSAAQLKDISQQGCSLRTDVEVLAVGEVARLQIPQLTKIEGRVTWQEGCEAGIVFAEPLHAAVVQLIAAQTHAKSSSDMVLRDNFGRPVQPGDVGRRPSPRGLIEPRFR